MYLSTKDQLRKEQQKNQRLTSALGQTKADLDYVTMMAGVDIPRFEDDGKESMNDGTQC